MPLGAWLMAMMAPLTARILLTLGFSVVTITGLDAIISTLKDQFVAAVGQVPADGLNLALLAGAGEAMGIIFGAIATRLVLWKISNATRILGVNSGA